MKITHTFNVHKIEDIIKYESQDSGEIYRKFTNDVYTTRNVIHTARLHIRVQGYESPTFSPHIVVLRDIPEKYNFFDFFALTHSFDVAFEDL